MPLNHIGCYRFVLWYVQQLPLFTLQFDCEDAVRVQEIGTLYFLAPILDNLSADWYERQYYMLQISVLKIIDHLNAHPCNFMECNFVNSLREPEI